MILYSLFLVAVVVGSNDPHDAGAAYVRTLAKRHPNRSYSELRKAALEIYPDAPHNIRPLIQGERRTSLGGPDNPIVVRSRSNSADRRPESVTEVVEPTSSATPMSREEIKRKIFEISDTHPGLGNREIKRAFAMRYPKEPHQPSADTIHKVLRYRELAKDAPSPASAIPYARLSHADRKMYAALARRVMEETVSTAPPGTSRDAMIQKAFREFHAQANGVKFEMGTFSWYYSNIVGRDGSNSRFAASTDKRAKVYALRDGNPSWSSARIADEFPKAYPDVADPPAARTVAKYLELRKTQAAPPHGATPT